jgi:SAM-dependent methyltransferase
MRERVEAAGRRFARMVTTAVVARPGLWKVFRWAMRQQFDRLASGWEGRVGPEALAPLAAALDTLAAPPRNVLDIGTGTGKAARLVAERFPEAKVVGVDLAPEMILEARRIHPAELADRVTYEVGDAAELAFADGAFDFVVLQNAFPFFDELARVAAPGANVVFAFSFGAQTPIWIPPEDLRPRLERAGFTGFREVTAGEGVAFLAVRRDPG